MLVITCYISSHFLLAFLLNCSSNLNWNKHSRYIKNLTLTWTCLFTVLMLNMPPPHIHKNLFWKITSSITFLAMGIYCYIKFTKWKESFLKQWPWTQIVYDRVSFIFASMLTINISMWKSPQVNNIAFPTLIVYIYEIFEWLKVQSFIF